MWVKLEKPWGFSMCHPSRLQQKRLHLTYDHAKWSTIIASKGRYCQNKYLLIASVSPQVFDSVLFLTSSFVIFRCLGVFISEEAHASVTVCPRHRETYGVDWKSVRTRCSVPTNIAGHKPSIANEDRGISGNESAFVLIINNKNLKFPPVGTGE